MWTRESLRVEPEVAALVGVPQPEKWHPEGDAFEHTWLVVDQAQRRYDDEALVYAAICHDLGKARTPKDILPKHYGHAKKGIRPTKDFLNRLGVDEEIIRGVCFTTEYHMHIHTAHEMKMTTYEKICRDFLSRNLDPYWIIRLGMLGVCDHYGRGSVDPNDRYDNPFNFVNKMAEARKRIG